jgi:hypothetical protein
LKRFIAEIHSAVIRMPARRRACKRRTESIGALFRPTVTPQASLIRPLDVLQSFPPQHFESFTRIDTSRSSPWIGTASERPRGDPR